MMENTFRNTAAASHYLFLFVDAESTLELQADLQA